MNIEDNAEINIGGEKTVIQPNPNSAHLVAGLLNATKSTLQESDLAMPITVHSNQITIGAGMDVLIDAHYFHSIAVAVSTRNTAIAEIEAITLGQVKRGAPIAIGLLLAVKTTLITYGVKTRVKVGKESVDVLQLIDILIGALTGISGQ